MGKFAGETGLAEAIPTQEGKLHYPGYVDALQVDAVATVVGVQMHTGVSLQ